MTTQIEALAEAMKALEALIYETTHLSPLEDDGSHKCKISKVALEQGRAALTKIKAAMAQGEKATVDEEHQRLIKGTERILDEELARKRGYALPDDVVQQIRDGAFEEAIYLCNEYSSYDGLQLAEMIERLKGTTHER